jgi:riboflavin synthase
MFNGIIEEVGTIRSLEPTGAGGVTLWIDARSYAPRLKAGDSVAVDGICLTTVRKKGSTVRVDLAPETWQRTNLKERKAGDRINLELPMTGASMISGHFVQGHIEGVAAVLPWKRQGEDVRMRIRIPASLEQYCIPKGSIALNGVSLTIALLRGTLVEVALIPYTLLHTNLGDLQPGQGVNVETDMIGRYVVSIVKKAYHKAIRRK